MLDNQQRLCEVHNTDACFTLTEYYVMSNTIVYYYNYNCTALLELICLEYLA